MGSEEEGPAPRPAPPRSPRWPILNNNWPPSLGGMSSTLTGHSATDSRFIRLQAAPLRHETTQASALPHREALENKVRTAAPSTTQLQPPPGTLRSPEKPTDWMRPFPSQYTINKDHDEFAHFRTLMSRGDDVTYQGGPACAVESVGYHSTRKVPSCDILQSHHLPTFNCYLPVAKIPVGTGGIVCV
ncbi:hypothetical protein VTK56DRAFT_5230 [Thermocarpiscus australiensis]